MTNLRSRSQPGDDAPSGVAIGAVWPPRVARTARADGSGKPAPAPDATTFGWENQRLLFDHIADAVFATDPTNRITNWTRSAERLFGYSAAEAVGRSFGELLPYRMAQPGDEREFFAALEAGRTWRGTGTVRLRDGSEIWLDSTVEPIMADGRLIGSVSVDRDITAAVESHTTLADHERFVNAVLGVVGALVVVLDAHGRVALFNAECERLTGYLSSEVVGRQIWDVVIPPTEVDEVRLALTDLVAGAFPNSRENHWLTRTGELRLMSWQNTCLADADGAVTHVIATGIDITEARRGDEALNGIEVVGRLLAEQGPVPAALDAVLGELETRMGYRFLSLYLRDGTGLKLGAQRGCRTLPERLDAGEGVIGRVYRTGIAELVPDVRSDPDYVPGEEGVVVEIAAPLVASDVTLGVLNIEAMRPEGLTESDLHLARTIADRLTSALRRSQAQEELVDRVRLFTALSEFAAAVNSIRDPELLAAALLDAVGAVVPADTVVITLLDSRDRSYRVSAVRGLSQEAVGSIIEPGDGTAGRAISERAVIFRDRHGRTESTAALRDYLHYEAVRTVAVPLIHENTVLGVISVGRADSLATFTDAEREVFAVLGSHAALAIANAHLLAEVSALAIRDGLTGLYNRRHFDAALDLSIARFKRHAPAGSLAAIMFDLDHFGEFNRRHGHLAGDAFLRLFGQILRERLRSADIVARYGGEEFVAILEDCGLTEAARLADEVRRELGRRSVKGADGKLLRGTVSAGCAVLDTIEPTREALLGRADAGLFMAKEAGRNRVVAV
jgi:diguanylate cyclase (GGDEF)-like protein/PAS domain S-box-containing protein